MKPQPYVAIYELAREWTTWVWLCEPCRDLGAGNGERLKYLGPCSQVCDRCPAMTSPFQRPDGSVDFAPTGPAQPAPPRRKPQPEAFHLTPS